MGRDIEIMPKLANNKIKLIIKVNIKLVTKWLTEYHR